MKKARVVPKEAEISHILGVDFGAAKIGLALADSETKIAFAYTTLQNNTDFLQKIGEIIEKENVDKIVIGIPGFKNKGNLENKKKYKEFGEKLGKNFPGVGIFFVEEMFTTKMAEDNLIAKGMKKIKRFDDQEAAKIILQSWLDKRKG